MLPSSSTGSVNRTPGQCPAIAVNPAMACRRPSSLLGRAMAMAAALSAGGGHFGGDVQELLGVGGGFGAGGEDEVVAGAFALGLDAVPSEPDQGVEPVEGAANCTRNWVEAVPAFGVGEFVQEDGWRWSGGQCAASSGRSRRVRQRPQVMGMVRSGAAEQIDWAAEVELVRSCGEEGRPGVVR